MKSNYAVLRTQWHPASKAVSGFLKYLQFRDQTARTDLEHLVNYVAFRDRSGERGRLFDGRGEVGSRQRRALTQHVQRSVAGLSATAQKRSRAYQELVISPEDAGGLDLRRVTRAVMAQLERDAGPLPPWLAAEHRNTEHRHTQVVLAVRREIEPGRFRELRITPARLQRMKVAMLEEIAHQRGAREPQLRPLQQLEISRVEGRSPEPPVDVSFRLARLRPEPPSMDTARPLHDVLPRRSPAGWRFARRERPIAERAARTRARVSVDQVLRGMGRRYRVEAERLAERREWASAGREREREWPE